MIAVLFLCGLALQGSHLPEITFLEKVTIVSGSYKIELQNSSCDCTILVCNVKSFNTPAKRCVMLLHELIHCAGIGGPEGHNDPIIHKDLVYALGCCLCEKMNGKGSPECFECAGWR